MKYRSERSRKSYGWLIIVLFCLVLISVLSIVGVVVYLYSSPSTSQPNTVNIIANQDKQQLNLPPKIAIDSHLLFVGDVFWGRGIEYYSKKSQLIYSYPFSGLSREHRQGYNAWIANMECPITDWDIPYQTQVQRLLLNCRPEFLPEAANWFTALSLANNHTNNNNGARGITQTRHNLDAHQIQYFGDYNMRNISNICDVIMVLADSKLDNSKMPIAMCGYDYVGSASPQQDELDIMRQYAKLMPVIALPHMGTEFLDTAEQAKIDVYRKLIENGADMVVGSHPHVVQNSENYNGKLIAYSVGNFIFDQQSVGRETILSLGIGLKISTSDNIAIAAYQSLNGCEKAHDSCLAQLTAKINYRPKFSVSYNSECFEQSSNIPKIADETTCEEILTRANWHKASLGLSMEW